MKVFTLGIESVFFIVASGFLFVGLVKVGIHSFIHSFKFISESFNWFISTEIQMVISALDMSGSGRYSHQFSHFFHGIDTNCKYFQFTQLLFGISCDSKQFWISLFCQHLIWFDFLNIDLSEPDIWWPLHYPSGRTGSHSYGVRCFGQFETNNNLLHFDWLQLSEYFQLYCLLCVFAQFLIYNGKNRKIYIKFILVLLSSSSSIIG